MRVRLQYLKILVILVMTVLMLTQVCGIRCLAAGVGEEDRKPQQLLAKSCALMDGDSGRLLYGKQEKDAMSNASTTKILTCILALEEGSPEQVVTVSRGAANQPKVHLGMTEGQQFYLKDLLYGLMLESYNDCAVAIAEAVSGSAADFAKRMNAKAAALDCEDSHFVTPNGLDAEDEGGVHHTTAYDLCKIMKYCVWDSPQSETFLAITQQREYEIRSLDGKSYYAYNHNLLLGQMEGLLSGKTGYTAKAGYCYVAALEDQGRKFCIALLACGWPNHKDYKWKDAGKLFAFAKEHYAYYEGRIQTDDIRIPVRQGYRLGNLEELKGVATIPVRLACEDSGQLRVLKAPWEQVVERRSVADMDAPVSEGATVGSVVVSLEGTTLYQQDLCAADEVGTWDLIKKIRAYVWDGIARIRGEK